MALPHAGETIQNFTATGRPFTPGKSSNGSGLNVLNSTECYGADAPNLLPRRYTDESPICIAVLPASAVLAAAHRTPASPSTESTYTSYTVSTEHDNPIKFDNESSGFKFWRRKSSTSSSQHVLGDAKAPRRKGRKERPGVNFVMKNVPRGEYLKHYAKDEQGRYVGSEAPADDCILREPADLLKWRTQATVWKNDL